MASRIRLNKKRVQNLLINNKPINRIMLNDKQIYPEENIESNEILIEIDYSIKNPQSAICFEFLQMFDSDFQEIWFDEIERIGNPEGNINNLNCETVILNNEIKCEIKVDFGIWGIDNVPAQIEISGNYDYAHAWLPDMVYVPHLSSNSNASKYKNYRYIVSNKNIKKGEIYSILITSESLNNDDEIKIKYLAFSPGYSYNINSITYEPYKLYYRDKYIFNYENRNDFQKNEMITINGVNYKARYLLGSDGSIKKYFHKNWYSNLDELKKIYLIKEYRLLDKSDNIVVFDRTITESSIKQVVEESDGEGKLIISDYIQTTLTFKLSRSFTSSNNFFNISTMLLFGEDGLINKTGINIDLLITNNTKNITTTIAGDHWYFIENKEGFYNNDYFTFTRSLGYDPIENDNNNVNYVDGVSSSTVSNIGELTYTLYTNQKIDVIGLPLYRTSILNTFITKIEINNTTLKEYTDKSLMYENEVKISDTISYIKRYFLKIEEKSVYCSYVKANLGFDTINAFRDIYVRDSFTGLMKKITIEELLTGNYPDGEFSTETSRYNYIFSMKNPLFSSTPTIKYTVMSGLVLLNKEWENRFTPNVRCTFSRSLVSQTPNGNYDTFNYETMLMSDDSIVVISVDSGIYSNKYILSNVFNKANKNPYLTGYTGDRGESSEILRSITINLENKDIILLFSPYWIYSSNYYTSYSELLYSNNENQVCKSYVDENGDEINNYPTFNIGNAHEIKTVKGVKYYRRIMATYKKAYVVFTTASDNEGPLYKYNKEYDSMLPYTPEEIINWELIQEDANTVSSELKGLKSSIQWELSSINNPYFGLSHGVIYIETDDGSIKKIDSEKLNLLLYKRDTTVGEDQSNLTAIIRFVDEYNNDYIVSTDAGTYNNTSNYHLWNLFSNINLDTNSNKGYLTSNPLTDLNRKFLFKIDSTAKIVALGFCTFYNNYSTASSYPSCIPCAMYYEDKEIYYFDTNADARSKNSYRGNLAKYFIFPEKKDIIKVMTKIRGLTQTTGCIDDTPYLLWERNDLKFNEITIEDLLVFDKTLYSYNMENASYEIPIRKINSIEFLMGKSFKVSNENYAGLGNCLLFDENFSLIDLTLKEKSSSSTVDTPFGELMHKTIWEDSDGNEFILYQNLFEYESTATSTKYPSTNIFTPTSNVALTGDNTNTNNMGYWLTRNNFYSTKIDGVPEKIGKFLIIGKDKKIGAIALSQIYYKNSNTNYFYPISYIKHVNTINFEKNLSGDIIEYNNLIYNYDNNTDFNNNERKTINGLKYVKRNIILENGDIYITWWRLL